MAQPITDFHNPRQASVVIRKLGEEFPNRKRLNSTNSGPAWLGRMRLRVIAISYALEISIFAYVCQGDNPPGACCKLREFRGSKGSSAAAFVAPWSYRDHGGEKDLGLPAPLPAHFFVCPVTDPPPSPYCPIGSACETISNEPRSRTMMRKRFVTLSLSLPRPP